MKFKCPDTGTVRKLDDILYIYIFMKAEGMKPDL